MVVSMMRETMTIGKIRIMSEQKEHGYTVYRYMNRVYRVFCHPSDIEGLTPVIPLKTISDDQWNERLAVTADYERYKNLTESGRFSILCAEDEYQIRTAEVWQYVEAGLLVWACYCGAWWLMETSKDMPELSKLRSVFQSGLVRY